MKVLLAVACLMAVGFAQREILSPGAKSNSFLYNMQNMLIEQHLEYFSDGVNMSGDASLGLTTARNDLCRINHPDAKVQNQISMIFGVECKKAFVDLYNEEPDRCGGVFCNAIHAIESETNNFMRSLIGATTDEEAFELIEQQIVNPIMEYSCKCANKMMGAWLGCKSHIGEATIWIQLQAFGGFNTTAAYLGGENFTDYWIDVVTNRLPWNDLSAMLNRTIVNLCQNNTQGEGQCYSYFYDTAITLYQWYLVSDGQKPSGKRPKSPYDKSCSKFDLSVAMDETASFDDIKDALVARFCNDDCSGLYQEVLLGCCTASMIKDEELEDAVKNSAERIKEIYVSVYENETEEASITIDEYFGYYDETISMLRDPTCENGVSYNVTPCGEDPCEGLSKKQCNKMMNKQNGGKGRGKGKGKGKGKGGKNKGKGGKKGSEA